MNKKQNNTISSCLLQAFAEIPFLLAISGIVLALCIGGFFELWSATEAYGYGLLRFGQHVEILQNALRSEAMCMLLPVFSTIPFAAAFLEDMDSGFIKSYLPRVGRGPYIAGKLLATGISGGMVSVIAILVYYHGIKLLLLPMEKAPSLEETAISYGNDVGRACVLFFCAGMLFSLLGMLFSCLTASKYMAYAAPFVWEYVLIILQERYLKNLFMLNPKEWVNPTKEYWVMGELGACIYMVLLIVICMLLTMILMARRLNEI